MRNKVLKYNANWQIIGSDSIRKAVKKVYKGIALFMERDTGETYNFDRWLRLDPTESFITVWPFGRIRRPSSIVCSNYKGMGMAPHVNEPIFSRWNIFVRDDGKCQFCGKKLSYQKGGFTFDHLHPKSKGGDKDWYNIVIACHHCNHKKANKSLEDSGLTLIRKPYKPLAQELRNKSIKIRQDILLGEQE